ncbi:LacI family DNA-binding transcriptional regulator [Sedimentibacter sp. MB31-C6]|uniref:LacI family DNA-binding transcriptional regulator n=1 Tax=Sedimentibacter sp. MB31-C6 TaxID=3109366 RepID=UPI002DDCADD6|nr:LacI family DNA-binding transcriptional regulator [Sedimentibacter sp. MB36-C1]WSI03683.1 LacI family DNA-binding transcriptional regulator [Sedimentibacter sp. MB36-C1]
MVTIKDISKKSGYSTSTVSKALNGSSEIGENTSSFIRKVANEMGYFPNAAARLLKTNHSNNIGVLFIDEMQSGLAHEYFSAVLNSVKDEAEHLGYDITFISRNIGKMHMSYYNHCKYRNCDGVVIACVDFNDPEVVELIQSEIPTVTIDHIFNDCTAILSDNISGVTDLVKYIYDNGHRKIAYIHGENTSVTQRRLSGFYKTCKEMGLEIPNNYIKEARYHDPKSSGLATRELLQLSDPPSCIMYPDDFSFIGGMNEIEKQGLKIPDDISVAGYDGIYLSQVLRPKLCTFKQNTEALGKEAANNIVMAITEKKTYIPKQIWIEGELLTGKSIKKIDF